MSTEEKPFKHTMLDPQFGILVPDDFPDERDAIHIATVAVYAETDLNPGDPVSLTTKAHNVMGRSDIAPLGIVDPFLKAPVKKGERFWVFLTPGSIKSLRHNWTHPAFDAKEKLTRAMEETPSHRRMKAFAASLQIDGEVEWGRDSSGNYFEKQITPGRQITFEEVIERTKVWVTDGEFWSEGGSFEGQGLYPEFWDDFEIITGIKCPAAQQYSFFSFTD